MKKVRYEEMLPQEIVKARKKAPIAYLPIGGLEWHGVHNVVGLDTIKVHTLAIKAAEQGGGLVFPPLFYGENRERGLMEFASMSPTESKCDPEGKIIEKMALSKANFGPGYMHKSADEQDHFYVELLVHILREIESLGFKVIIIFAGHYPLLNHARAAIEYYNITGKARAGKIRAWAVSGYEIVRDVIPDAGDHGGKWETSLLMALRPECVDMSRLPKEENIPIIGVMGYGKIVGVNPRNMASQEFGKFAVKTIVDRVVVKAHKMLKETEEITG